MSVALAGSTLLAGPASADPVRSTVGDDDVAAHDGGAEMVERDGTAVDRGLVPALVEVGDVEVDINQVELIDDHAGTMSVSYYVTIASESTTDLDYELTETLSFGDGAEVIATHVASDDATTNSDWDGAGDTALTDGAQTLAAGGSGTYVVTALVRLGDVMSDDSADCALDGDDGTGLSSTITLVTSEGEGSDDACLEVPRPDLAIDKAVTSGPVRDDDGRVTVGYSMTVTNTGEASTVYDLTDEFQFAADARVVEVEAVNVSPGGIEVNPAFDGDTDQWLTSAPLAAGASHRFRVTVTMTDSFTPPGVGSSADLGDDSSTLADLMLEIGKGAAGQVGGTVAGYVLSAFGLSGGDTSGIQGELATINQTLIAIENELDAIDTAIVQADCNQEANQAHGPASVIKSRYDTYVGYINEARGLSSSGDLVPPSVSTMDGWADDVINGTATDMSVQTALSNIDVDLEAGGGTSQGIIQACLESELLSPPGNGTLDDRTYYDDVYQLINYWYVWQMRGLWMLQEAYHFKAQQALDVSVDPDVSVCAFDLNDAQHDACQQAYQGANTVYSGLANQFEQAGAPYTNDDVLLLYHDNTQTLYVRTLEDFTHGCSDSLSSQSPCGLTVRNYAGTDTSVTYPIVYQTYPSGTWRPATFGEFTTLLAPRASSQTPYAYLDSIGVPNTNNKVVQFHDTFKATAYDTVDVTATKFVDNQFTDGIVHTDETLENFLRLGKRCPDGLATRVYNSDNDVVSNERHGWYNLAIDPCNVTKVTWETNPGWRTSNGSSTVAQQYTWPVITVQDLTCTNGRVNTNPGGAQTMCGADFDAWFDIQVPRPASCTGTTFATCGSSSLELGAPRPLARTAYDCDRDRGEAGTGLLSMARATHSQGVATDGACAPTVIPRCRPDGVDAGRRHGVAGVCDGREPRR